MDEKFELHSKMQWEGVFWDARRLQCSWGWMKLRFQM